MKDGKENFNRSILDLEVVIGVASIIMLLTAILVAGLVDMPGIIKLLIIIVSIAFLVTVCIALLKIEQMVGFYECGKCHHKYVPTFKAVLLAMHFGRTRYMKCQKCHENSWQKKTI